jgi:hypothetical protein
MFDALLGGVARRIDDGASQADPGIADLDREGELDDVARHGRG